MDLMHIRDLPLFEEKFESSVKATAKDDFRPIHYLGSKLRMLDTIESAINSICTPGDPVCDLFAGSGSVSRRLSYNRRVTSVDIQEYSRVICSAMLNPMLIPNAEEIFEQCRDSEFHRSLAQAIEPIVVYEKKCTELALRGNLDPLCEFLEEGSLIRSELGDSAALSVDLKHALKETLLSIKDLKLEFGDVPRITKYFGGIYFSYSQSSCIDSILHWIRHYSDQHRDTYMAAVLSTASDVVNTVGKQFAQPLQPRGANGLPKNNLAQMVLKDRNLSVFSIFNKWLGLYGSQPTTGYKHVVQKMDFLEALDCLDPATKVIYADPPYTRDHYSRFYHVLETICLGDDPGISKTRIGGDVRLSRGLYRNERHQSPFCIKSQAPKAFESLFRKCSSQGTSLVLSYSPYNQNGEGRPRVMTIENLLSEASKHFSQISKVCPGSFSHSKLNRKDKNFSVTDFGETLIVCQN